MLLPGAKITRDRNCMEIALIGLPQSGKTTLLNALTRGRSEVDTYGNVRQEMRVGVTGMRDIRLDNLARLFGPDKVVQVEIKYLDVPAVPVEAANGAGIGGQYLNLLQDSDALLHVVRAFEDPSVPHAAGGVDPDSDVAMMQQELALSDMGILERRSQRIETSLKGASGHERDTLLKESSTVQRLTKGLEEGIPVRSQRITAEESGVLSNFRLLTAKPILIVINVDEATLTESGGPAHELEERLAARWDGPGVKVTSLCARLEMELSQLDHQDELEFRESMGLRESGVDRIVGQSYELLSLISFFTYVSKEVRAWSVPDSTPATRAAGKIHSDMERGFIRAEVIAFDDLVRCGSVAQVQEGRPDAAGGEGLPGQGRRRYNVSV